MSEKKKKTQKQMIVISDEKHGLPYSKGLMASSIMATGLSPSRAYRIAQMIEGYLRDNGIFVVTMEQLKTVAYEVLDSQVGEEYAQNYLKWQALAKLDRPLIILIGGTTGVGKSTIASEVAHRLGLTRTVNTDSIREVMRAMLSKQLMPAIYNSSFDAWKSLRVPLPKTTDPVIIGFREQAAAVIVGIRAIIDRAIREGTSMVIEGVHLIPGAIDSQFGGNAFVMHLIIGVEDENMHRSHFYIRGIETEGTRPFRRYRENFGNIRRIGQYIEGLAAEHGVPVIMSYNLDVAVSVVLEEVIKRVMAPPEESKVKRIAESRVKE